MKKTLFALLLATALVLCGCGKHADPGAPDSAENMTIAAVTEETVPATVPADGDPSDVTCKGSYTGNVGAGVVASAADAELTARELQVWYWAEAAQYRLEAHEIAPDFDRPLDTQVCEIDDSVASWQQYFLGRALNAWHTAQALIAHSEDVPLPTEEAYQPSQPNHETYLPGMPATAYLYGYNEYYKPNSMHQAYLDTLPDTLTALAEEKGYSDLNAMANAAFGVTGEAVTDFAEAYNLAYMYFTTLSHAIEPSQEELDAFYGENAASYSAQGEYVDIRHILLVPEGDWEACEQQARELLEAWQKDIRCSEYTFAELANKHSADTGTALDGGAYHGIRKGQLMEPLDDWCFAESRQPGDTTIVRSEYGVHILYLADRGSLAQAGAEQDYYRQQQTAILAQAREAYPMEVDYSAITLTTAEAKVAAGDILYPDIAHERYPEIPLYLQQDYPKTMYGGYKISSNGCGITSMAMVASYLADEELTPPEMCARFGNYSHYNGTDGMIFNYESSSMGFYLREKTYEPRVARAALEEGQIVISIQHPGYWTRGGHYIVCESITEDGMVQVRDSNIYNYGRISAHKNDLHKWGSITTAGSGFWIFEDKVTYIPACTRCGTEETITAQLLTEDYTCHKCKTALLRRETYLAN